LRRDHRPAARFYPDGTLHRGSVTSALERVISASQKVVTERTELVFIEVRELLRATFEGLLALGLAIGLFLIAWTAAVAALILFLMQMMSRSGALATAAALNLVLGAALVRLAMSKSAAATAAMQNRRPAGTG
jgi:uncharacterized membrane protein YqjE